VKRLFGLFDFFRILRVHRAGQAKFRIVRDFQCLVVILRLDHREHGSEHFLLEDAHVGCHIREHRWLDEIAVVVARHLGGGTAGHRSGGGDREEAAVRERIANRNLHAHR